jgi:hypothetical protein
MRLIEPQSLFKDQPINKTVVEIINHYSKPAKHAALRKKSKDLLARNQNNMC